MTDITRPIATARPRRHGRLRLEYEMAIRTVDIAVSLLALILLAPLLVFLIMLVRSTSKGPTLFRQDRLGLDKRTFTLLKLRTMYANNDDRIHREYVAGLLTSERPAADGAGLFKLERDPRITVVGGWLRKTSLDELPQFFNVLKGDMSLVGPRPVLAWEAELFSLAHQERFRVKPGITGLWQVSGRSRLPLQVALDLDNEYVQRRSLSLDLKILLLTLPALLRGGAA